MKKILTLILLFNSYAIYSQDESGKDSTAFLDSLYGEMDAVLDEMMKPQSFISVSVGVGTGFYNFKSASATQPTAEKRLLLSPSVSYLHKSGFSISVNTFMINDKNKLNLYQFAFSPSYDYIVRGRFATGISFTRYQTRKDLSFYTTPIQNEAYSYFTYRKTWLQPGIAVAYGWGSRTSFEERRVQLLKIRKKRNPALVTIRNDESVRDFSALFSLRHNFHFSGLIVERDLFTITPVILITAGTQSFGFNTSFQSRSKVTSNFLPNNQYVKGQTGFDAQSATMILRCDYSKGIFFVQSQLLLDYYLHLADKRLNNAVSIAGGINF